MTKFIAILLYVWLGSDNQMMLKLEQSPYKTMKECLESGHTRITELEQHPNFVGGLFSRCVELPILEA